MSATESSGEAASEAMSFEKPAAQHEWLMQLLGDWTYEAHAQMKEGDSEMHSSSGTESVRSLGGLWIIAEGKTLMDGAEGTTLMTVGYDPRRERFVGSWFGSMMTNMWVYEGQLSEDGKLLPLNCEGPNFETGEGTVQYRDTIEIVSADHRRLRSSMLKDNGEWFEFMRADYYRK